MGGVLGTSDTVGGGGLGLGQGLLVIWLVGGLLAAGPLPNLAAQAQRSVAVRALDRVLPSPTQIAGELWAAARRVGPAGGLCRPRAASRRRPGTPVDPTTRAIAEIAIPSTVEVQPLACSYPLAGSGFVIEDDYVVTNAHVVAGCAHGPDPAAGGGLHRATSSSSTPDLDIALLYVPDLDAPALAFPATTPSGRDRRRARLPRRRSAGRHAGGRVDGHPRGARPRPVRRATPCPGAIIELRASIERGDSGGPFVLQDGTVGGVVFAQARSDPTVGYALSPVIVAETIAEALGETDESEPASASGDGGAPTTDARRLAAAYWQAYLAWRPLSRDRRRRAGPRRRIDDRRPRRSTAQAAPP